MPTLGEYINSDKRPPVLVDQPTNSVDGVRSACPSTPNDQATNKRSLIGAMAKVYPKKPASLVPQTMEVVTQKSSWDDTQLSETSDGDSTETDTTSHRKQLTRRSVHSFAPPRPISRGGLAVVDQVLTLSSQEAVDPKQPTLLSTINLDQDIKAAQFSNPYRGGSQVPLSRERPHPTPPASIYTRAQHQQNLIRDRFKAVRDYDGHNGNQKYETHIHENQQDDVHEDVDIMKIAQDDHNQAQAGHIYDAVESEYQRGGHYRPVMQDPHEILELRRNDHSDDQTIDTNTEPNRLHNVKPLAHKPVKPGGKRDHDMSIFDTNLDYPPERLRHMKYSDLKDQPFDTLPTTAPTAPTKDHNLTSDPEMNLYTNLAKYRDGPKDDQVRFFSVMEISEWEKSGKWFVDQFGLVMNKMIEARRSKRERCKNFEDEINKRAAEIATIDKELEMDMKGMKSQGQALIATPRRQKIQRPIS